MKYTLPFLKLLRRKLPQYSAKQEDFQTIEALLSSLEEDEISSSALLEAVAKLSTYLEIKPPSPICVTNETGKREQKSDNSDLYEAILEILTCPDRALRGMTLPPGIYDQLFPADNKPEDSFSHSTFGEFLKQYKRATLGHSMLNKVTASIAKEKGGAGSVSGEPKGGEPKKRRIDSTPDPSSAAQIASAKSPLPPMSHRISGGAGEEKKPDPLIQAVPPK
jgi:hypothetical protein